MGIGRNDPCPCGSGLKYKKCCGTSRPDETVQPQDSTNYPNLMRDLALNRAIGYKGDIGRMRENMCKDYLARKKSALKEIERDLLETTEASGEKISCRKGCSTCCTQYIWGTLQECESIVYYLYKHQEVLADFIQAYPAWRAKVRENEFVFEAMNNVVNAQAREGVTEANRQIYDQANLLFMLLNIPCPFLKNNACSIHEVRPWKCAQPVVTTPSEWCHPSTNPNNEKPKVYRSKMIPEELPLYHPTNATNVMLVYLGVWEILSGGYWWLSKIPSLQGFCETALADPEVKQATSEFMKRL